jgi:hypothetical protein
MGEVYNEAAKIASADPPGFARRGVSIVKPIEAAKEAVPTIDLADRLCGLGQMRRVGERWVACCPLPDHEDKTPSFVVYLSSDGWWCYGCNRGGDVVDLARLAWGYPDDGRGAAEAAAFLLMEFGHEVSQRPPSWFRKQERQRSVKDRIDRERTEHVRMLVFRLVWVPWLRQLPEWVREEATKSAWASSRAIALRLYEQRRGA